LLAVSATGGCNALSRLLHLQGISGKKSPVGWVRRPQLAETLGLPVVAGRARPLVCSKYLQQNLLLPPPVRPIRIVRQNYHANVAYLVSLQTRAFAGFSDRKTPSSCYTGDGRRPCFQPAPTSNRVRLSVVDQFDCNKPGALCALEEHTKVLDIAATKIQHLFPY